MAKRKARKLPKDSGKAGILKIIAFLAAQKEKNNLCDVGQERLTWWRRYGVKYPSVRAALKGWTNEQLNAYFNYIGWHSHTNFEFGIFCYFDEDLKSFDAPPEVIKAIVTAGRKAMKVWKNKHGSGGYDLTNVPERRLLP